MTTPRRFRRRRAQREAFGFTMLFALLILTYVALAKGWFCWPFI